MVVRSRINDMKQWVEDFFSEFHRQHLKSLDFKKVRHTFSRDKGVYIERFNFQGSDWNTSNDGDPWLLYINVGVEFKDLPARTPCADFTRTHWWQRIEDVAPDAPNSYDLRFPVDIEATGSVLITHMQNASNNLSDHITKIRRLYLDRDPARLMTPIMYTTHKGN